MFPLAPSSAIRDSRVRSASTLRRATRRTVVAAAALAIAFALNSVGRAAAVSYQGYGGDFAGGFLVCLDGFGQVATTNPPTISIANENPSVFFEDQRVWTTSMLYVWDSSQWVPASGWSHWRYTDYTEGLSTDLSNWQEWTGSSWISNSNPASWSNLNPGYYTVITWMYFGARPGVADAGWAYSWPTPMSDSSPYWCKV